MKNLILYPFAAMFVTMLFSCQKGNDLILVRDGKPDCVIVVPDSAAAIEIKASGILQKYIERMSGVRLNVVHETEAVDQPVVLIGNCRQTVALGIGYPSAELGDDGIVIRTFRNGIALAGGPGRGTMNAVYTFLEDVLGCRKYSEGVTVVPEKKTIRTGPLDIRYAPPFILRTAHFPGTYDQEFSEWHRLHSAFDRENLFGRFVHTFNKLIPPEKYFGSHPEYFTLFNGIRIPGGQLCLTNPDVFRIVDSTLTEWIKEKPQAPYWSVSQNDTYQPCDCPDCSELNRKHGGYSGSLLSFVNRIAEKQPDRVISTLAYQYSRSAPQGIKPADNVNIMLCSIECNRSKPLASDLTSSSFVRDLTAWCNLTENIFLWDYVVQFRNLVSPFPNLRVLQPNIRFFRDHHVKMMFQQGSGGIKSEFYELRQYIIAKLLWNPDADVNGIIDDFLKGFYGNAAPFIREYIDLMHKSLEESGDVLNIYGFPFDAIDSYLTPGLVAIYEQIFDKAIDAVKDQPDYLDRVRIAQLPLEFAILELSLRSNSGYLSYFDQDPGGKKVLNTRMVQRLIDFVTFAEKAGYDKLNEGGTTPSEYKETLDSYLNRSITNSIVTGDKVMVLTEWSEKYPVGGAKALTDGMVGLNDYHYNWLGFEGEDMEAVIDMGSSETVSMVSASFLQNIVSWVFMPEAFSVSVSTDGTNYHPCGEAVTKTPVSQSGSFTETFRISFPKTAARFIKVKARNMKTCPPWHSGAGLRSWIFCDEVFVE